MLSIPPGSPWRSSVQLSAKVSRPCRPCFSKLLGKKSLTERTRNISNSILHLSDQGLGRLRNEWRQQFHADQLLRRFERRLKSIRKPSPPLSSGLVHACSGHDREVNIKQLEVFLHYIFFEGIGRNGASGTFHYLFPRGLVALLLRPVEHLKAGAGDKRRAAPERRLLPAF